MGVFYIVYLCTTCFCVFRNYHVFSLFYFLMFVFCICIVFPGRLSVFNTCFCVFRNYHILFLFFFWCVFCIVFVLCFLTKWVCSPPAFVFFFRNYHIYFLFYFLMCVFCIVFVLCFPAEWVCSPPVTPPLDLTALVTAVDELGNMSSFKPALPTTTISLRAHL